MANVCPQCGATSRDGALFCGGCGARLGGQISSSPAGPQAYSPPPPQAAPASQVPPPSPQPPPPMYQAPPPTPGMGAPQAAVAPSSQAAAAAAVGQAAKTAAQKSWEVSKQSMGFLTRLVTGGGRAAYTELFKPVAIVDGYIVSHSTAGVPAPLEIAAFLFVAVLISGWLLLLVQDKVVVAAILLVAWIGLLALCWIGVRRPYFSRLTLTRLRSLIGDKSKGQVVLVRATVNNLHTGQPVDVVMVGPRSGPQLAQGNRVRVYGIPETDRNEVRAWRVDVEANGAPIGTLMAGRLIPLTVALFLPVALLTLAVLGIILFGSGGAGAP